MEVGKRGLPEYLSKPVLDLPDYFLLFWVCASLLFRLYREQDGGSDGDQGLEQVGRD